MRVVLVFIGLLAVSANAEHTSLLRPIIDISMQAATFSPSGFVTEQKRIEGLFNFHQGDAKVKHPPYPEDLNRDGYAVFNCIERVDSKSLLAVPENYPEFRKEIEFNRLIEKQDFVYREFQVSGHFFPSGLTSTSTGEKGKRLSHKIFINEDGMKNLDKRHEEIAKIIQRNRGDRRIFERQPTYPGALHKATYQGTNVKGSVASFDIVIEGNDLKLVSPTRFYKDGQGHTICY